MRARHDEYFRQTAEALAPDLYFQPFADHLECYLVKEPQNGTVVCLWLRSPESLDLRMPTRRKCCVRLGQVGRSDRDQSSLTIGRVGGVGQCRQHPGVALSLLEAELGVWRLYVGFTYHQDHGDQGRDGDHRYDRPAEMSGEVSKTVTAPMIFTV